MAKLLSTREVSKFLNVNEKMVYTLVSDKGLPATKITGKWLFPAAPRGTVGGGEHHQFPQTRRGRGPLQRTAGDRREQRSAAGPRDHPVQHHDLRAPGGVRQPGSMGGLRALRRDLCHLAASHLLQEDESEYNFAYASEELGSLPAVVNFCRREQGIIVRKGNPKKIARVADLGKPGLRIVNRPLGTGTRLLLDRELNKAGVKGEKIEGYAHEVQRHLDVGLEVLSGRADAGPGIRPVAALLNLGFIPLRWERFDLMASKERFFEEGVQRFLGLLHDPAFHRIVKDGLEGYDLSLSGKMVFPHNAQEKKAVEKQE